MSTALATVASPPEWVAERAYFEACIRQRDERIRQLEQRIAWFERQIFGEKSERRFIEPPPEQMALGEGLGEAAPTAEPTQPVAAHQRRRPAKTEGTEPALFFDPERVPVQTIAVPNPEIAGLPAEAYEVIGEKVTHRARPAPGQLRRTQVRAPSGQGQRHRRPILPPGPGGRARRRACRCQLPGRPGRREVQTS